MTTDGVVAALGSLAEVFDDLAVPGMLIGGLAVIVRGVPRSTLDIDATIAGEALDLERALDSFRRHGIEPRIDDAERFAREHQVLLLRHRSSGTPLDVSLAWLPFEHEALARATPVDFGGVTIAVAAVDDLIVYKAVAWRERDRNDIERLLRAHGEHVNLGRIRDVVAEFSRLLDEPERLVSFDALVAMVQE